MKVLYLFDFSKFPQRESASRSEFEADLEKLLPEFIKAYEHAFQRMCEERSNLSPKEINSRWAPDAINRHIHAWLINHPEFSLLIKKEHNTFYLEMGKYKLQFKKLNDRYRPSYHATKRSSLNESNRTSSRHDLKTIIFIGYQVDATWSDLKGIYAVSLIDKQIDWILDLHDLVSAKNGIMIFDQDLKPNNIVEPEVKIKVKDNNSRRKKA